MVGDDVREDLKSLEERKAILAERINAVRASGAWIESKTDTMADAVRGKQVDVMVNVVIAFFTAGLWITV